MYAKYKSEISINSKIPTSVDIDGVHYQGDLSTKPDILLSLGYLPVIDEETNENIELENGYHLESRYKLDKENNRILRYFIKVEDTPRNLSLSKRKLMLNLKAINLWDQVRTFLEENNVIDDFYLATTLDEQDPLMQNAINVLKVQLNVSDEEIEQILENSIA